MMSEKPMKAKMSAEEKRYKIEDAARTLKQYALLRKDKALFMAARGELQREISASQEALKKM